MSDPRIGPANLRFWSGLARLDREGPAPAVVPRNTLRWVFVVPLLLYTLALVLIGWLASALGRRSTRVPPAPAGLPSARRPGAPFPSRISDLLYWSAFQPLMGMLSHPIVELGAFDGSMSAFLMGERKCDIYSDLFIHTELLDRLAPASSRIVFTDARQTPFPSGSVRTLLFLNGIGYAIPLRKTLGEAFRILSPGGRLVFNAPAGSHGAHMGPAKSVLLSALGRTRDSFAVSFRSYRRECRREGRRIMWATESWWRREAERVGFEVEHSVGVMPRGLGMLLSPFLNAWLRDTPVESLGEESIRKLFHSPVFQQLGRLAVRTLSPWAVRWQALSLLRGRSPSGDGHVDRLWILRKPGESEDGNMPSPHHWVCPSCREQVVLSGQFLACGACGKAHPVIGTVPVLLPLSHDHRWEHTFGRVARYKIASHLESKGELETADRLFKAVTRWDGPTRVDSIGYGAWFHRGRIALKRGEVESARECLERVLEYCPEHRDAAQLLSAMRASAVQPSGPAE